MNCNRIAPFYKFLETIAFAGQLQKYRTTFMQAAQGRRHVLVLGDGDGRFTQALLAAYPSLQVDSIELSAGMVAQASKRAVQMTQADAFSYPFAPASYDMVFTHFFLDCFPAEQLDTLISRISEALTPEALWVISDFRQAVSGWRRIYTRAWLSGMYLFFKCVTSLQTQSLADYQPAIASAGFLKAWERVSRGGLIASELWSRQRSTG